MKISVPYSNRKTVFVNRLHVMISRKWIYYGELQETQICHDFELYFYSAYKFYKNMLFKDKPVCLHTEHAMKVNYMHMTMLLPLYWQSCVA